MSDVKKCYFCDKPLGGVYSYFWSNPCHAECVEKTKMTSRAADRIEALERALDEIIMEATSRNHAIDIARRARNGDDKKISQDAK